MNSCCPSCGKPCAPNYQCAVHREYLNRYKRMKRAGEATQLPTGIKTVKGHVTTHRMEA